MGWWQSTNESLTAYSYSLRLDPFYPGAPQPITWQHSNTATKRGKRKRKEKEERERGKSERKEDLATIGPTVHGNPLF